MTRDELIEKARAFIEACAAPEMWEKELADFCLPLLAQARAEAIEEAAQQCDDLRDIASKETVPFGSREAGIGAALFQAASLIRTLRAPGQEKPETNSGATPLAKSTQPQRGDSGGNRSLEAQASARGPSPASPAHDWADAIAREWIRMQYPAHGETRRLAALLRERLGPCVEALEAYSENASRGPGRAKYALDRLRGEKELPYA